MQMPEMAYPSALNEADEAYLMVNVTHPEQRTLEPTLYYHRL